MKTIALLFFVLITSSLSVAADDVPETRPQPLPDTSEIQKRTAVLEEKIRLLTEQLQLEKQNHPELLARQSEALHQRIAAAREQMLLNATHTQLLSRQLETSADHKDTIESMRMAYTSLAGIAPDIAKAMDCAGKNVVLYGPAQSDALLSLTAFNDQLDVLRARLKSILDITSPAAPDRTGQSGSMFAVAALSSPVQQSVLDLISFFQASGAAPADPSLDEAGAIAVLTNAANSAGCLVYWPDQYAVNPYNPGSQVLAHLRTLADLNDNGGAAGKPAGLQQKLATLRIELKRSESMSEALGQKIEKQKAVLADAERKVAELRIQIDFLSTHIKNEKTQALQEKLNKTFEKSWEELEIAVRKQIAASLPGTMEEQGKVGEMGKRVDVLKTRTDWLAQYIKDEKELAVQDKLKRTVGSYWDQLDAAVKNRESLASSIPQAIEPDLREQRRWDKYSADLKELIAASMAASEAYTTFRGALLDGASGASPLNRMLRAESLRDLTFDDKLQERAGASVVQFRLQRLAGSRLTKPGPPEKESFTGGVVLSFVQYEPNGKLKNSGVFTAYTGAKP